MKLRPPPGKRLVRDWDGMRVVSTVPMANKVAQLPAGTRWTVYQAGATGLHLVSDRCPECGVAVRMSHVSHEHVEPARAAAPGVPVAPELPYYPATDVPDEREPGVHLLDFDDDVALEDAGKVTAQRVGNGWRVVDWEVLLYEGAPTWFARSWHTVPDRYVRALARLPR